MPIPGSMEELSQNPGKYGIPTLEEVTRKHYNKRDQLYGRGDEMLQAIDRGDPVLGCRQRYYVDGYRVNSLEQAERIAREMGLKFPHDFVIDPQLREDSGHKFYNHVTFWPKGTVAKRAGWK